MAKRRSMWIDELITDEIPLSSQSILTLWGGKIQDTVRQSTVTRVIGRLGFYSGTVQGAYGVDLIDFGIGIVGQEAFTAGAVPDPDTDADRPSRGWIYRDRVLVSQNGEGGEVVKEVTFSA